MEDLKDKSKWTDREWIGLAVVQLTAVASRNHFAHLIPALNMAAKDLNNKNELPPRIPPEAMIRAANFLSHVNRFDRDQLFDQEVMVMMLMQTYMDNDGDLPPNSHDVTEGHHTYYEILEIKNIKTIDDEAIS